jgi:predicted component of type VI protein secretion system
LTAAEGLDSVHVLDTDRPVPSGNELAPDTAAGGAKAGSRGGTVVTAHRPMDFVAPSETIDTTATASARLSVLTEPLAGHEFVLDGECCFIGRTEENDIVLDHESVSRRHAKVVRAGDRYLLVDLQSANGVRVNGVEQSQVELHGGDMVTLGLVCLRFAGAANAAARADDFRGTMSRGRRIVALTAMLGVPAAIIVALAVGHRHAPHGPATATLPTPVIEDFTHIREGGVVNPIQVSPVGVQAQATGWAAAQPSARRSVKSAPTSAAREQAGRRHSAGPVRVLTPRDLTSAKAVPAVETTPRRPGGRLPRTIDTENPYPADQ